MKLKLGNAPMRTNVTLITCAVFFALTFGIAHAADTNAPSTTGAAVGTPGSENKGNPIPAPDQATGGMVDKGDNPSATTPAEESKGKPKVE
jgi:hypothetical protein